MKIYAIITFFLYFSLGAIYPLFSQYLSGIGFTGTQIGTIFSIGTFSTIIFQPLWGLIADKTNSIKKIIIALSIISTLLVLVMPFTKIYILIMVLYTLLQLFMCGLFPLNDAGILHSPHQYGKVRQWGAVGFAVAVVVTAFLVDHTSEYMIFIVPGIALIISVYFLRKISFKSEHEEVINSQLLKELFKNKDYLYFMLAAFFVGGTINAHNTYFGLLYKEVGGQVTGIGFAFLLFALSEAPFFRSSGKVIEKIGVNNLLLIASFMFCARWLLYGLAPSPKVILFTFFMQGLSIGSFLAGSTEYIKQHTRRSQTATAITFYNSVSLGIGAMSCIYISGKIMDAFNVAMVYKFYFLWSLIGFVVLIGLNIRERKNINKTSKVV